MALGSPFWRHSLIRIQVFSLEKTPDGLLVGLETETRHKMSNCSHGDGRKIGAGSVSATEAVDDTSPGGRMIM